MYGIIGIAAAVIGAGFLGLGLAAGALAVAIAHASEDMRKWDAGMMMTTSGSKE